MATFQNIDVIGAVNLVGVSAGAWHPDTARGLTALPSGSHRFWGIPFEITESEGAGPSVVGVGANASTEAIAIELNDTASHVVFAHICDSRARDTVAGQTEDYAAAVVTAPGEHIADYVLVYEDGTTHSTPVRRRFEVNQVYTRMQSGFACRAHQDLTPLPMRGPYPENMWGRYQTIANVGPAGQPASPRADLAGRKYPAPSWSIYALPNPHPGKRISELRIVPTGAATIGIGAITLFTGAEHPLRHERLQTFQLTVGAGIDPATALAESKIDLGVIARRDMTQLFDPDSWLSDPVKSRGEAPDEVTFQPTMDIAASVDASVVVGDHRVELGDAYRGTPVKSADGEVAMQIVGREKTWLTARVVDADSGQPIAARVHMRSPEGRYLPPYGHRQEVNDNWFEDYGADVKLGDTQYAYVDGKFSAELPVGDVFFEVSRGFEYQPVRQKIEIANGQKELEIRLSKTQDRRSSGWVTADTHVHFISPDTARLEADAEGVNVINLLAAQWGDLFTNVGDITGKQSGASTDETIVWVGTENRQHFLGHISMLGVNGDPVFPMSTSGATEGYFGDPTERAMSEWADECKEKDGLVVVPHFPFPHSEILAEVIRGRVDGLEFWDFWTPTMDTFSFHEYYRLLNCGYRAAVVGGTDKMSAGMPVGNVRTYAQIGDSDLSFDSWADAVRAGRTYTTSGPLMSFVVEGNEPGSELQMPSGGGRVHVSAEAISLTGPIHKLEIVYNGAVIATVDEPAGATSLKFDESVQVPGSGWLAARCVSNHKAWSVWPQHIAAHTSPVFVKAQGETLFDNPTAEYLVTVMEGGIAWLDTLATRAEPARHAAVLSVFEEAIADVRGKQHEHGHSPEHGHPHSH